MLVTLTNQAGSKDQRMVLKKSLSSEKPQTKAPAPILGRRYHVRRVKRANVWFTPNTDYTDTAYRFYSGVMLEVVYNPNAPAMPDVICQSDHISDADAIGELIHVNSVVSMPSGIKKTCYVAFDRDRRVFHDKDDPSFVIKRSDYLILYRNGQAVAGWFAEYPDLTSGN